MKRSRERRMRTQERRRRRWSTGKKDGQENGHGRERGMSRNEVRRATRATYSSALRVPAAGVVFADEALAAMFSRGVRVVAVRCHSLHAHRKSRFFHTLATPPF